MGKTYWQERITSFQALLMFISFLKKLVRTWSIAKSGRCSDWTCLRIRLCCCVACGESGAIVIFHSVDRNINSNSSKISIFTTYLKKSWDENPFLNSVDEISSSNSLLK